ncbi:type II toxin-antitoxin system RelE/ParE family toxin [Acidobacteriota bacterium]
MYTLKFLGQAVDDLKRIDRAHQKIIKAKLGILAANPLALKNNIRRLSGTDGAIFRLRVGSYRVIFQKERVELVILIIRIGHRKDIYAKTDANIG